MTQRAITRVEDLDSLDFTKGGGSITVVTQDARSRRVLMVARADREALEQCLLTGEMHYHSRTRGLWHKGATSGNVQRVAALYADCDADAVLALVHAAGPACHTGAVSCFAEGAEPFTIAALDTIVAERAADGESVSGSSYTRRLLDDRNLRLKKLGEESAELVTACADGDRDRAVSEAADLLYHALVALRALDAGLEDVERVLEKRHGLGIILSEEGSGSGALEPDPSVTSLPQDD
jgi:phosphoribosyl-AMP cyclohydrolase / phosphoribosyl-ATP pyrophosphohydrolase